jgi:hypothetical protein
MRITSVITYLVAAMALVLSVNAHALAQNRESAVSQKRSRDWQLVNEFGNSKCFVDSNSIEKHEGKVRALVMYSLDPPGTDKRNNKQVAAMLNVEEYDLAAALFRVHRITFHYADGTESEPLGTDLTWKPATGGNQKTLAFFQARGM